MAYFPLFIDLAGKEILVVGGGGVAERRVEALLEFGCRITVVAIELSKKLMELGRLGRIKLRPVDFAVYVREEGDRPYYMVLAATDDREVNQAAAAYGRRAGAFVNVADRREASDFYFPGIIKRGPVVVGVTAGGEDHWRARRVTEKIRQLPEELFL